MYFNIFNDFYLQIAFSVRCGICWSVYEFWVSSRLAVRLVYTSEQSEWWPSPVRIHSCTATHLNIFPPPQSEINLIFQFYPSDHFNLFNITEVFHSVSYFNIKEQIQKLLHGSSREGKDIKKTF